MLDDTTKMQDIAMLDTDREAMRAEFDNFDDMTLAEFRIAHLALAEEILSLADTLGKRK